MEGVDQAIGGDVPARRQPRFDFGAAALELGEAIEDGFGRGVEVGATGVLAGVEPSGAGFGAVDQGSGGLGQRGAADQGEGEQQWLESGSVHEIPWGVVTVFMESSCVVGMVGNIQK